MTKKEENVYLNAISESSAINFKHVPNDIKFLAGGEVVLEIKDNGDIYVKGNLVENDKEVITGLRYFLAGHGVYNSPIS